MFFTWMEDAAIGRILLAGDHEGLRFLVFDQQSSRDRHRVPKPEWEHNDAHFRDTIRQLKAYFAGDLQQFDVPLAGQGTEFQKRVWKALKKVPYGETATYGDIAKAIGSPTASRAVGMANGRNPISIIVPCHRIIGTSGKLVGYGGGLHRKTALLKLEGIAV
ncbi:MAG: methylated-DNA--[protein]-cysteine S-methyltransferase [Fuerstiella sp.]